MEPDRRCPRCGGPAILGSSHLGYLQPDDEPFAAGVTAKIESEIELDMYVHMYYCQHCDKIIEFWIEPESLVTNQISLPKKTHI